MKIIKLPTQKQLSGWARCGIFGGSHSTLSQHQNPFIKRSQHHKTMLIIKMTDDEKDFFHERKSIIEYDGNVDRELAEWQAIEMVYNRRKGIKELVYTVK